MPTFTKRDPATILIGRARLRAERQAPFVEALRVTEAGRIELGTDENPNQIKRDLSDAASEVGVKIRSSWEDKDQKALLWKRSSTSPRPKALKTPS